MKDALTNNPELIENVSTLKKRIRELEQSVKESRRTEEALRESETKFRFLSENMADVAFIVDMDLRTTYVSPSIKKILGFTPEERRTQPVEEQITPQSLQMVFKALMEEMEREKAEYADPDRSRTMALEYYHKDGSIISLETNIRGIRDCKGALSGFYGLSRDITERKKAEEALRQECSFRNAIIDNVAEGLCVCHETKEFPFVNFTIWNGRMTKITGYTLEEINRLGWYQTVYPDPELQAKAIERMKKMRQSENLRAEEWEITRADGNKRVLNISTSVVESDDGVVHALALMQDITERKLTEQAYRDSEFKYRSLIEHSSDVVFCVDQNGEYKFVNQVFASTFGRTPDYFLGKTFWDIYPKEHADHRQATSIKVFETGESQSVEVVVPLPDRTLYYIAKANPVKDETGKVLLNVTHAIDITDRKLMEEELKKKESYNYALFEYNPEQAIAVDLKGKVIAVNRAKRISGDRLPNIGDVMYRDYASSHEIDMYSELMECLGSGKLKVFPEKKYRGKFLLISIAPFSTGAVIISNDITERKQAEDALKRKEEEARRLAKEKETVAEMGRIISSNINIEEVYGRFAEEAGKVISFDRLSVNIINPAEGAVTVAYAAGLPIPGRQPGDVFSVVDSTNELVATKRYGLLFQPKIKEEMDGLLSEQLPSFKAGLRSQMAVPLITEGQVIGILNFLSKKQNAYTDADLRLGEEIGLQIAGAIANAQLYSARLRVEKQLQDTLESLRKAVGTTIQVMVSAVETRDPYTSGHQTRSANLARTIAMEMGLSQEKIDAIRMAGSIHDIGKLSIPAEILSKPTKLSEIEFSLIKEHASKGSEMLKDVESPWPLAEIVHQHHERMDGSGYPRNLKGEVILIEARILGVADVVEAMASHRPYRPGLGINAALAEIEKNSGIFYDKAVAEACLRLFREKGFKLEDP